jgi:hypothetical protein
MYLFSVKWEKSDSEVYSDFPLFDQFQNKM